MIADQQVMARLRGDGLVERLVEEARFASRTVDDVDRNRPSERRGADRLGAAEQVAGRHGADVDVDYLRAEEVGLNDLEVVQVDGRRNVLAERNRAADPGEVALAGLGADRGVDPAVGRNGQAAGQQFEVVGRAVDAVDLQREFSIPRQALAAVGQHRDRLE